MWDNGHAASPFFIVAFYGLCHYCSAVTMFKELDMREAGDTFFSDVLTFFQRVLDVLFYDIQMAASVIHGNRMLEGMTQVQSARAHVWRARAGKVLLRRVAAGAICSAGWHRLHAAARCCCCCLARSTSRATRKRASR